MRTRLGQGHHAITAALIAAGISLLLSGGFCATSPRVAVAEEASVTINSEHPDGVNYDAYCVFVADVAPDDTATHVSWATEDIKETVLTYLDDNDYDVWLDEEHPEGDQHDVPQNALAYISLRIADSPTASGTDSVPRTPEGRSFAQGLARHLASESNVGHQTAQAGTPFVGKEGFWLFVSGPQSAGAIDGSGTSALWIALGGSTDAIEEKTAVPTIHKEVCENATGAWGALADAHRLQPVSFRLTSTLPQDFAAYDEYHLTLVDSLSAGLELTVPQGKSLADAVQVSIDGTPVVIDGKRLSASYEQHVLRISFPDLASSVWNDVSLAACSHIIVTYQAHLGPAARLGSEGNPNEAYLIYTNDPVSHQEGRTKTVVTKVFCWQLVIAKEAQDSRQPLEGARFTLRRASAYPADAQAPTYVQRDGSLGPTPYEFATDRMGKLSIAGLDSGAYLATETAAPASFQRLADDIPFTIETQTRAEDQTLVRLGISSNSNMARASEINPAAGIVTLCVANAPEPVTSASRTRELLAQTGVGPVAATLTCSGMLVLIASNIRRRMR